MSTRSGRPGSDSYSDSKLFVTSLALAGCSHLAGRVQQAVTRLGPPPKMGGAGAPDHFRLGHLTQEWLASSDESEARSSGETGTTSDSAPGTRARPPTHLQDTCSERVGPVHSYTTDLTLRSLGVDATGSEFGQRDAYGLHLYDEVAEAIAADRWHPRLVNQLDGALADPQGA